MEFRTWGSGKWAPAQQRGDLVRIDAVVLGLSPVNGAHVQRVSEHEGNALALTQVRQPVPGEHAFDGHDQIVAEIPHRSQERLGTAFDVARQQHRSVGVQDTQVHHPGVQVDTAVVLVLLGIESHLRPPL
jgi:hypothetical protein